MSNKPFLKMLPWIDYLLVFGVGGFILLITYQISFPHLSLWDEVVYAVMGRNIGTGRGIISNYYHPRSIIEKGYPLGDVHMPGHMFFLGISFALLGESEYAAIFPSHVSYLVGGLLLYWVAKGFFDRQTGIMASIFFFTYPIVFAFVNTAMSELTLALVSAIFFAVWYKCLEVENWYWTIGLALVVVFAALHHETALVFLLPSFYVLWRWPRSNRVKAIIAFCLTFVLLFGLIFWPLHQMRAPYPHLLSTILNLKGQRLVNQLLNNTLNNIQAIFNPDPYDARMGPLVFFIQAQYFLALLAPLLIFFHKNKKVKIITAYVVVIFWGTFAGLVSLYPLINENIMRTLLPAILAGLVLLAGLIGSIKKSWLRYAIMILVTGWFVFNALHQNRKYTVVRQDVYLSGKTELAIIDLGLELYNPQTIAIQSSMLYGWENYPATVIWELPPNAEAGIELDKILPIEAIVARTEIQREKIENALQHEALSGKFVKVSEIEGITFYVRQELVEKASRLQK